MALERGLAGTLGFEILPEREPRVAEARFTVTEALVQPFGLCSGGTMLALEETLAGVGSIRVAGEGAYPLGIEVSANHVRAASLGEEVHAVARPLQTGYRIHVWNVELYNARNELLSTARVVNAIKRKRLASFREAEQPSAE